VAWGKENGIAFDHGKSEAVLFSRRRKVSTETIRTREREIPFNTEGRVGWGYGWTPTSR